MVLRLDAGPLDQRLGVRGEAGEGQSDVVVDLQKTRIETWRLLKDIISSFRTSIIFSMVCGSMSEEVTLFSAARTTPSEVVTPIAVEPNLMASKAYSTWRGQ